MIQMVYIKGGYVFNTTPQLSPELLGVIEDYDLLPRPAGVGISYVTI